MNQSPAGSALHNQRAWEIWGGGLCLLLLGLAVLLIQLRGFSFAGSGLDPSWMRVLEHAAVSDWQWGRDIVFTFGPLGYLSPGLYHPDTAVAILLWQLLLGGAWMVFFSAFSPMRGLLLMLAALPAVVVGVDHLALALPFAAALLALQQCRRRALLLFLLAGVAGNVKFSSLIVAVAMAGIVDLNQLKGILRLQRLPASVVVAAGFVLGYLLAGQSLVYLPSFLIASLQVASGYSDAMVQYWQTEDMAVFLGLAVLAGGVCLTVSGQRRRLPVLLAWAVMVFLLFKFGYVRHAEPRHFQALAGLVCMMMFVLLASGGNRRSLWITPLLVLVVAAGTGATIRATPKTETLREQTTAALSRIANRWKILTGLTDKQYWNALALRRERTDLQVSQGWAEDPTKTIDALGWDAGAALMSGGRYMPRPVFQSYAAYAPALAALNLSFWEAAPPQRVLFQGTGIDAWWPGLADGELHRVLQRTYQVAGRKDTLLQLDLAESAECSEAPVNASTATVGQWVELPPENSGAVRYLRLEIQPTLMSLLRKTVYKSQVPEIEARLADGQVVKHKFPRSFSGLQFPLSPMIRRGDERLLFQPGLAPADARVSAFRVPGDNDAAGGIANAYSWQITDIACQSDDSNWVSDLISSAVYNHKIGPKYEAGALFAHAPMLFQLPVESLTGVRLTFGIRNGAWKQGDTDGVRFDIVFQDRSGKERLLSTRTLKPKQRQADREDQEMAVDFTIPQTGTLMIGILPLENTGWDWSYIRDLSLDFSPNRTTGNQ